MKRLLLVTLLTLPLVAPGLNAQRARPDPEPLYDAKVDPTVPGYLPGPPITGTLKGICSETFPDLMKLWIDGFRKQQPGVTIEVAPTGGGGGSQTLAEGQGALAADTPQINPAHQPHFVKPSRYTPLEHPVS